MQTLHERLQYEAVKKLEDEDGALRIDKWDSTLIKEVISRTISETLKEAVRVIEGEKRTSRFTAESAEVMGFNDGLSTAITTVEGLMGKK